MGTELPYGWWKYGTMAEAIDRQRKEDEMAIQILDAPQRKGNLSEKVPALDEIIAALSQTTAGDGKVVGITDPEDKPGTARNITRHAMEMLAKQNPPVIVRAHLIRQDDKYVGAISYKPEKVEKAEKPARAEAGKDDK